jgi:pyrroline-5-carboxylate reductase
LKAVDSGDDSIRLSPRNADIALELSRRYPRVSVASSNQDVLDSSDMVVLALPPRVASDTISALRFRTNHHVVSVISGFSFARIAAVVAPATDITRAVPLPSVAACQGLTAMYPPNRQVAALFGRVGTAIEVELEEQFDAFCAATATIASHLAFADTIAAWLARHGIPEAMARNYMSGMFRGVITAAVSSPRQTFASLASEHATPGGINEQVLHHLIGRGVFETLSESLDAVWRRLTATRE